MTNFLFKLPHLTEKNRKFNIKHNNSPVAHTLLIYICDFTCCHGCRHRTPWSVGNPWDWQVEEGSWWKLEPSSATDWDAPLSATDKDVSGSVRFLGLNKVLFDVQEGITAVFLMAQNTTYFEFDRSPATVSALPRSPWVLCKSRRGRCSRAWCAPPVLINGWARTLLSPRRTRKKQRIKGWRLVRGLFHSD